MMKTGADELEMRLAIVMLLVAITTAVGLVCLRLAGGSPT